MPTPADRQRRTFLHGDPNPLDHGTPLALGPLSLRYFPGELRYLRFHNHPVALRIYAAVRDENWATIPTTVSPPQITAAAHSLDLTVHGATQHPTILLDFSLHLTAATHPDGSARLSLHYTATARSAFRRNRIGLCILHPASLAANPVTLHHTDGSQLTATFPRLLDPRQPPPGFTDLAELEHTLPDHTHIHYRFSGDAFEMEDQRNWTDASYKTFCTPLRLPFPVQIHPGHTVSQSLHLTLTPPSIPSTPPPNSPASAAPLRIPPPTRRVRAPELGTVLPDDAPPTPDEALDLARIGLPFFRVNLPLASPDWQARLAHAADLARGLDAHLELALYLSPDHLDSWEAELAQALAQTHAPLRHLTLLHAREAYAGQPFLAFTRPTQLPPFASLATGTDGDAIFLGRLTGLPPVAADTLCLQINPSTHANDELSLLESLAVQPVVIESAHALALGRRIAATPVSLTPRLNLYAYATGHFAPVPPDPRIKSLFAAGWTLASYAALASAHTARITFHTASGPAGIALTPTAHLLEQLCTPAPTHLSPLLIPTPEHLPPTATAIALHAPGHTRLLIANHTDAPLTLRLPPPASAHNGPLTLHLLDETYSPLTPPRRSPIEPDPPLTLPPYALAILDSE